MSFFDIYKDLAIATMKKTGVLASVTLAQAALESGYGKHAPGFNFFGIKGMGPAGRMLLSTHEVVDGKTVSVQAHFKRYHDAGEAFEDHAKVLIYGPLGKQLEGHLGDALDLIKAMQKGPLKYATDPDYVVKAWKIINDNGLEEFDKQGGAA